MNVTTLLFNGANAAEFTQTNTCGSAIPPGGSCRVEVTFKPTATGARSAGLDVYHNGGGSPHPVVLDGKGK